MLCSNCSRPVTPVVAIDIDGTLGDYHTHFIRFAQEYLGLDDFASFEQVDVRTFQSMTPDYMSGAPKYDGSEKFKEWGCKAWGIDERTWHDIKLAYRQGAQKRSMPVYPGAAALCGAVVSKGCELWLTTTRPYLRLDNIDPDTRFWLSKVGISYDGLLYDEAKYTRLAEYVDRDRVIAVVDDLPDMFEAAAAQFGWRVPIFRRNLYNRAIASDGPSHLGEVAHLILDRVDEWRNQHDSSSDR